jgi:hypothetical protein
MKRKAVVKAGEEGVRAGVAKAGFGALFGITFQRSRLCVSAAFREIYVSRNGAVMKWVLLAIGLGAGDVVLPLVTGQTWLRVPETLLIEFTGAGNARGE